MVKKGEEEKEDLAGERREPAFYAGVLMAGLGILAQRTEKQAAEDDDLKYDVAAAEKRKDVKVIRDGLIPRLKNLEWASITKHDRVLLSLAGEVWTDTMKNLIRLCGGLTKVDDQARYRAELANVTKYLTPMLADQGELFAGAPAVALK